MSSPSYERKLKKIGQYERKRVYIPEESVVSVFKLAAVDEPEDDEDEDASA